MNNSTTQLNDPYSNPFEPMVDSSIFAPIQAQEPWSFAAKGKLFLIVGPAGAGKTTILNRAKKIIGSDEKYSFPKRVIVKQKTDDDEEDFEEVSTLAFASMITKQEFAFHWTSQTNVNYGIRAQDVDTALSEQKNVVIQVSRSAIEAVKQKYGETNRITAIEISADPTVLGGRLRKFKKLSDTQVKEKLKRTETLKNSIQQIANVITIDNNGSVDEGVDKLLIALLFKTKPTETVSAPPLEEEKETAKVVTEKIDVEPVFETNAPVDDTIVENVAKEFFDNVNIKRLIHEKAERSDNEHKRNEQEAQKKTFKPITPTTSTPTNTVKATKVSPGEKTANVKLHTVHKEEQFTFTKAIKWIGIVSAVSAIGYFVVKKFNIFGKH